MVDATGRILYVGKAKRLRTRLLTYFRARYPDDKAARILYAAHDIRWDYVPSEFAAYLGELRQIRRFRPYFNSQVKPHPPLGLDQDLAAVRRRGSTAAAASPAEDVASTDRFARMARTARGGADP